MFTKATITITNEDIIRSVIKKVLSNTSSTNMPFDSMVYSNTKSGYGFTLNKIQGKHFLSVRNNEKLVVYIKNEAIDYFKTFTISDIPIEKLPNSSAVESYRKYCINTIYTIIKTWLSTKEGEKPDLGNWYLYKY